MTGITHRHCISTYRLRHGLRWANRMTIAHGVAGHFLLRSCPAFISSFFCRASLLSALGGRYTNCVFLVLTCRLFQSSGVPLNCEIAFHDVVAWAGALAHSPLRCWDLGIGLSVAVHLWSMLGSVALLGDTLVCGNGHRLLPHENHRCCGCHEHVFGQSAHFCFSVAKFGTAKPVGFYGTLTLSQGLSTNLPFSSGKCLVRICLRRIPETKRVFAEPSLDVALSLYHLLAA